MEPEIVPVEAHSKGERSMLTVQPADRWPVDTPGGRFYAEWESCSPVTREGQLIFFFQFLEAGERWREFLADCPLSYVGNRGSGKRNVMGTIMLSILCGHWRYAHINSVRGDRVNASLLGMERIVSEDVVRTALKRMDEAESLRWVQRHILDSISPALSLPWILDLDTTVKCLYGHQQGAQIGYNPRKPGRPCHIYHSYFVANLRISLGVEVLPGKESAAPNGMPGLWEMLERLPRERWPTFARGDCGYGSEKIMCEFEARELPYLLKLRHTAKVKALVRDHLRQSEGWQDCGDGWEAAEATLKLSGWTRPRRVVLVREAPALAPVGEKARRRRDPFELRGAKGERLGDHGIAPWSGRIAVLVTSLDEIAYPTTCMPKQYRDRGDAENTYDELKNQWGWSGYSTQKIGPSRIMANLIALFYNWWNLYVRFFDEHHHREAITSRPALMQGVARQVQSGGQRTIKVSLLHENGEQIAALVSLTSKQLQQIKPITERWSAEQKWALLLTRLLRRWLGGKWLSGLPPDADLLLSG
jgi:Transposase DDE domain group 1